MIVYAGKQYWNDFNNWDEALFQDANRPRDEDKFKIQPWMQSSKWDWKKTTKNRDASIFNWYWIRQVVNTTTAGTWYDFYRLRLKDKFTVADMSQFEWYQQRLKTRTAKEILWYVEDAQTNGNPKSRIVDWDLEILESGSYVIECFVQFLRPNWHTWSSMAAMGVWLLELIDNWYKVVWYNMSRSCTDIDGMYLTMCTYIDQWTRIAPCACEWYWTVMAIGGICALRTW